MALQRAIAVKAPGPASVLQVARIPAPTRKPGEILVKVVSTSVNPIDYHVRSGRFGPLPDPWVPGGEIAGVVLEADADSKFKPGDKVFALTNTAGAAPEGSYQELFSVNQDWAARVPDNLPLDEAGGVPLAGLTAWQALEPTSTLTTPGKRVLVLAASGGVGHFAVQIAKAFGAYVVGQAGPTSQEFVKELGADEVINYKTQTVADAGKGGPFDVVVDSVGGESGKQAYDLVAPGGLYAHIWNKGTDQGFITEKSELHAEGKGPRVTNTVTKASSADLTALADLIAAGKLRIVVDTTYPLDQAQAAHEHLERGSGVKGKVLLKVQDP